MAKERSAAELARAAQVYRHLSDEAARRTSVENVVDVLAALAVAGNPEREALKPFVRFAAMYEEKPIGGTDLPDEYVVYAIHVGTPWEAAIRLGDLRRALDAVKEVPASSVGLDPRD